MGLIKTAIKTAVVVKTAHVVHDRIDRRKQQEWVAQGHSPESYPGTPLGGAVGAALGLPPVGAAPAAQAVPSPVAAPPSDMFSQLRELGELRAAGILTDDEFETQKRRILAS
jgi:hypothetical protein